MIPALALPAVALTAWVAYLTVLRRATRRDRRALNSSANPSRGAADDRGRVGLANHPTPSLFVVQMSRPTWEAIRELRESFEVEL